MNFMFRSLAALVWLIGFMFIATPARAEVLEMRSYPEPQIGLWKTIALDSSGGITFVFAGSAQEACKIQHESFNPLATFVGAVGDGEAVRECRWIRYLDGGPVGSNTTLGTNVFLACPGDNYVVRDGLCVLQHMKRPFICNDACGNKAQATSPDINIGDPININSGLKVLTETDYETADGLFSADRQYVSRKGVGWQLVMPGYLDMYGYGSGEVNFHTRGGGKDQFVSTNFWDQNVWTFTSPNWDGLVIGASRRSLSMVTVPTVDRTAFLNDKNVSPTGPPEMRVNLANGEYILFRRANGPPPAPGGRRLVPVEYGKPGGYKIFYDYNNDGYFPYRVRDSLNRIMALTWVDAPGPGDGSNSANAKVISQIQLPDGTKLDYTYDQTKSSFIIPIPGWAVVANLPVRGSSVGAITVIIEGRKDRLRNVTRRSATGATLWQRNYDYEYNYNPSALTRVRDQSGATLFEYTYVAGELLASSKRAGGVNAHTYEHYEVYSNNWRLDRFVRRVIGPLGQVDDYWMILKGLTTTEAASITNINRWPTTTTEASTRSFEYQTSFIYAQNHLMTKSVDELGRETNYQLDYNQGRPTGITEATGTSVSRQSNIEWHAKWDLPTRITRDGVRVDITYNGDASVATQTVTDLTTHTAPYATAGQARTTAYTWGANARLLSINGPLPVNAQGKDDITSFAYDGAGNVISMTNPLGHITTFAGYDANGRPASMTDPNGVVTQFTYDALGRATAVRVKHPTTATLDALTSFTYDAEGRVKTITAPASTALTMNYDLAGLLKSVVASNGERIDYGHDAMGNVTSQTVKRTNGTAASTITQTFDAMGRLLTETLGPGRSWSYAYDKASNLTKVTTPKNQSTAMSFDALDRLIADTRPDGGAPTLTYDLRDGVTSYSDPIAARTTFVRNGFGEVIQEVSPERGTSTYYYDSAGQRTAGIDGRGQRTDYSYDLAGRLLTATPTAAEAITYTWDVAALTGSFAKGRLSRIVNGTTTIEFAYDHRGNVTAKRQRIGTGAWMQLSFTYDLADRRTSINYPSGRIVEYTYNTLGRVTQVRTKATAATTTWTNLATGMTYEAFGSITRADYGNGLRMIQSWGNDGRLANRRLERSSNSARLSSLTYSYDANDNITAITDTLDTTKTRAYSYDVIDRLTRTTGTLTGTAAGTYGREDFIYDKNGNRLKVERRATATALTPVETDTYTIATGTNRLRSIANTSGTRLISHDGRGNQITEQFPGGVTVTVAYDGHARLTRYRNGGASQTMLYNGMDERIQVVTTPAIGAADTRVYLYDLDHRIVGEYGATGTADIKAEYIWLMPEVGAAGPTGGDDGLGGYMPLATAVGQAGTLNWLHTHHHGAPIFTTNAAGTVVPYPAHAVLGFPGQFANSQQLAGAQHYYNRYRDYDVNTGRYIQADPLGLAGDDNPYAYAGGNPLRFMDPLGLQSAHAAYLWIEGNNRKEPTGHLSVSIGSPRGSYTSVSFGVRAGQPFPAAAFGGVGEVYADGESGGPIMQAWRIPDEQVAAITTELLRLRGKRATYWLHSSNCRDFSIAFTNRVVRRNKLKPAPELVGLAANDNLSKSDGLPWYATGILGTTSPGPTVAGSSSGGSNASSSSAPISGAPPRLPK
jgi:RHS repeat-associated protein